MPNSTPPASSMAVRRRMREVRRKDTHPELRLRRELHRRGLRYRIDIKPIRGLPRKADVVFPGAHVAVFVDGCFWHFCPDHISLPKTNSAWWRSKLERTRRRDADTTARLQAAHWGVVRVWEHDDPVHSANLVESLVRARKREISHRG